MAVAASVGMYRHGVSGRMTADTELGVQDMAQTVGTMVDLQVDGGRGLVLMAIEAFDRAMVGIHDHILNSGAGGDIRVDITGFVVTGGTAIPVNGVQGEDCRKVADHMAVGAGLEIGLAAIG